MTTSSSSSSSSLALQGAVAPATLQWCGFLACSHVIRRRTKFRWIRDPVFIHVKPGPVRPRLKLACCSRSPYAPCAPQTQKKSPATPASSEGLGAARPAERAAPELSRGAPGGCAAEQLRLAGLTLHSWCKQESCASYSASPSLGRHGTARAAEDPDDHEDFVLELSTEGYGPGLVTIPPLAYLSMIATKIEHVFALVPGSPNDPEQLAWLDRFEAQLDNWTSAFDGPAWRSVTAMSRKKLGFGFCRLGKLIRRFDSQEALTAYVTSETYGNTSWPRGHACPDETYMANPRLHMALILDQVGDGKDREWAYTIQTNFSVIPLTYPKLGFTSRINVGVNEKYIDQYMMSGFLTLQQAVDRVIINQPLGSDREVRALALRQVCDAFDPLRSLVSKYLPPHTLDGVNCSHLLDEFLDFQDIDLGPLTDPVRFAPNNVRMAEFPTPEMVDKPFYRKIKNVFGLDLVLTFLWPISRLVRGIVHEKETRAREGMRMMGLQYSALYWSWFITYGAIFFVISAAITGIAQAHLFSSSDPVLVFAYFFVFCLSIIAYCFMVSVLFNRAKTASTAGVVLFFVGFFPFFGVNSRNATASAKAFASLLAPTAFGLGASTLATYEAGFGKVGLGVKEIDPEKRLARTTLGAPATPASVCREVI
ncbi:ATP-binding cassette sub-family A member 1 [Hondaea fermentalgiana]|uniref:ATP-binding cassette sub-family A member 1 n=1 Tax=Hondaea fermentalgiana TaxID=2315210 RepID=A0A2R5G3S3_9STRA|nr:ATP-binding cassette sub-family A member 1 [Hondaea fermentalgiana]|eukprot:GBG25686.1 ATP-binding cassette sub-family A member 1 [Hondaea fermentalgiana]